MATLLKDINVGDVIYEHYKAGQPLIVVEVQELKYVCKNLKGQEKILPRYRGLYSAKDFALKYPSYAALHEEHVRKAKNMGEKIVKLQEQL